MSFIGISNEEDVTVNANPMITRRALVLGAMGGAAAMVLGTLPACSMSSKTDTSDALKRTNDIVTFDVPQSGRLQARVGLYLFSSWDPLRTALDNSFSSSQWHLDYRPSAGINNTAALTAKIITSEDYDLCLGYYRVAPTIASDLSSQGFMGRYLQTITSTLAEDGKVYGIPLPSEVSGIYYNKDLFAKNGWSVPSSIDDFVSLCGDVRQTGVTPFFCCLKYPLQTLRMLQGMLQQDLFTTQEDIQWYADLIAGKATFAGHIEPLFELAKRLFDEGILTLSDFNAALTDKRRSFFAGDIAMIEYASGVVGLAEEENCPFDMGLMGYPSSVGTPTILYQEPVSLFIPKDLEGSKDRYATAISALDYFSSQEGQDVLLQCINGVSNLKGYSGTSTQFEQVKSFIDEGNYNLVLDFAPSFDLVQPSRSAINNAIKSLASGTSVEDAIAQLDTTYSEVISGSATSSYSTIANASNDLSMLETSYYVADVARRTTGADVGIIPNGGFYESNLTTIFAGDISDNANLFYMKGVAEKDCLTTYKMTGAQLKTLLEHPIIKGDEVDQLLAASGLSLEYAPWHARGSRVVKATMEDGTAIDDAATYTVASFAGMIDSSYVTSTVETFEDVGKPEKMVVAALKEDGSVKPDISKRVKLDWDIVA